MPNSNCMVAQSGGPTAAINASLSGVISGVRESGMFETIYGSVNGILGILNENYLNLSETISSDELLDCLKHTPAMYLGSCRHKLPSYVEDDTPYIRIFEQFAKYEIKAFFYIGGNDSMDTVLKLSDYAKKINSDVRIIGVPKTIDNDLCMTDHTPGFGSAAKYIATTMLEIAHDTFIYPIKSVTLVEIMGRDAGWLTAASALARNEYNTAPHLIYLPEVAFDPERFLADIREQMKEKNNIIVAVSEGIRDKNGEYIASSVATNDTFGHQQLSGVGKALEYLVKDRINVKVRSIEINVLQRCGAHIASVTDIEEAFFQGKKAVELAENGCTAEMVCLKRLSNSPYTVSYEHAQIQGIANQAKSIPTEWIHEDGNDITPALYEYLYPLIQGEYSLTYENGIPKYMNVSHLKHV